MTDPGLAALLPEVPAWGTAVLVLAGVPGAFVTTAFGAGGGVLLPGVLPVFLPVTAVIPVHGVLQAGSNGLRSGLLIRHIRWPLLRRRSLSVLGAGGVVTGALTLFLGATGPFVAALLGALRLERHAHMTTFSVCMLLQHALKIAAFGLLGFAFGPWLAFIAAMFVAAFVGTWLGRRALGRMGDARFHRVLVVLLTLLALRLVVSGLLGVTSVAEAAAVAIG